MPSADTSRRDIPCLDLNGAKAKAIEYLQDTMKGKEVKITEAKPALLGEQQVHVVSGNYLDKDGKRKDFELTVDGLGNIVSEKYSPTREFASFVGKRKESIS